MIEFDENAKKELARLDRQTQIRILKYLRNRVAPCPNPRDFGAPLRSNLAGLWKYRIGDYRIIVEISDEKVLVIVVRIGHRSKVYGGH